METLFTAFLSSTSGMGEPRIENMDMFGRFFVERNRSCGSKKSSLKIFEMKVFKMLHLAW